jgi:hypothetical protein
MSGHFDEAEALRAQAARLEPDRGSQLPGVHATQG